MNFVDTQIIISTIGWSLIHFLWQGSLITFLYWLITRSTQSIHIKYWTGMTLVIASLIVPLVNSFQTADTIAETNRIDTLSNAAISYQQLNAENLFLYLIETSLPFFVMMWGVTVVFLSVRLIKSWLNLAAIQHDCDPKTSNRLKQYIKTITIKLDLPIIPTLKVSKSVMVPAAYGLFKPTILLPLSLIGQIPQDQLEAIIKHELCHLKRNDFIHNIIQLCADILLFFHPGIRWMNNDIRHIREQCCDQMVLSHQTEAITYAKALTNIAAYTNGIKQTQGVHLGINDGMLLNRVKYLLQNKSSQSSLAIFMPILLLIILATFLLQSQPLESQSLKSSDNNTSFSQSDNSDASNEIWAKRIMNSPFYPTSKSNEDQNHNTLSEKTVNNGEKSFTQIGPNNNLADIHTSLDSQLAAQIEQQPIQRTEISGINLRPNNRPEEVITNLLGVTPIPVLNQTETSLDEESNHSQPTQELSLFDKKNSIMPKLIKYLPPTYPANFWFNQVEQDVIATFKIKSNGKAYDISVNSQVNGYMAFENEVVKAIRKWKFDTASLNQATLQRTYQQMFSFSLSKDLVKNCESSFTGSRLKKLIPCNK